MPKTSINENGNFHLGKDEIRPALNRVMPALVVHVERYAFAPMF